MQKAARRACLILSLAAACKAKPPTEDNALAKGASLARVATVASSFAVAAPGAPAGVVRAVDKRDIFFSLFTKSPPSPARQKQHADNLKQRFPKLELAAVASEPNSTAVLYFSGDLWPAPSVEHLKYFGRDMDGATIVSAAASKGIASFGWKPDADPKHDVLREAIKLMGELGKQDAGYIWDVESREMFSVVEWKKRETSWDGDIPDVPRLFTIHYYEDEGRNRAVSLGLAKLGVPDLVMEDVPNTQADSAMAVFNACAQLMVEGATSDARGRFTVDFAAIKHKQVRERLQRNV